MIASQYTTTQSTIPDQDMEYFVSNEGYEEAVSEGDEEAKQSEAVSEAMSSERENKRRKSTENVFKQINGVKIYATKAILCSL